MSETDHLLNTLIQSVDTTNRTVEKLAVSVDKIVIMDAKREETDKQQLKVNDDFKKFIELNREPLNRYRRWLEHWDKSVTKIITITIMCLAAALGFNWLA